MIVDEISIKFFVFSESFPKFRKDIKYDEKKEKEIMHVTFNAT